MGHGWQFASVILVAFTGVALAQAPLMSSGSIFSAPNDLSRRHMSPYGKPCLTYEAYAQPEGRVPSSFSSLNGGGRAQASTLGVPRIYQHGITASNSCGQNIKVKVCYYKTDECIVLDVPPWGKKEGVLGIYPGLEGFRYDAKELFP